MYTQDIYIMTVVTNMSSRIYVSGVFHVKGHILSQPVDVLEERCLQNMWLIQQGMVMKACEVNNFPKEGFVSEPFPPRAESQT